MIGEFINDKAPGILIVLDGANKGELKRNLKKLLKKNGLRLTGWRLKND